MQFTTCYFYYIHVLHTFTGVHCILRLSTDMIYIILHLGESKEKVGIQKSQMQDTLNLSAFAESSNNAKKLNLKIHTLVTHLKPTRRYSKCHKLYTNMISGDKELTPKSA